MLLLANIIGSNIDTRKSNEDLRVKVVRVEM